jgi:hypothetical protein
MDYQIYLKVELPRREWRGTTFLSVALNQFFTPDTRAGITQTLPVKLEGYETIPPVPYVELIVHKQRQPPAGDLWPFFQRGDKAQAILRRPVQRETTMAGYQELEPLPSIVSQQVEVESPAEKEARPPGRRRTILKAFKKVVKTMVAPAVAGAESKSQYRARRSHSWKLG